MASLVATAGAFALTITLSAPPAVHASWPSPSPGYAAWAWATGGADLIGVAVRSDGYLIVASGDAGGGDGFLHLIPPWGAAISSSNRFGPSGLHPYHLAVVGNYLVVAPKDQQNKTIPTSVYVLDVRSGQLVRTITWFGLNQSGVAVDPQVTSTIILEGDPRSPQSSPALWRLDPATGNATPFISGPPNGTSSNLDFSWDGNTFFFSSAAVGQVAIYAYDRSGNLMYTVKSTSYDPTIGGVVQKRPSQDCFGNSLFYTSGGVAPPDGTALYLVQPPYAASPAKPIAQQPNPTATALYSDMTTDAKGHLIVSLGEDVMLVSCAGTFIPPTPAPSPSSTLNAPAATPKPSGNTTVRLNGGQGGTGGGGLGLPGPPPALNVQAAPATQAQTATAAQNAHQAASQASVEASSQGAVAPNAVGLVDIPEDNPAMSFSAQLLSPWRPSPLLPIGTAAVLTFGAGAWYATRPLRRDPRLRHAEEGHRGGS